LLISQSVRLATCVVLLLSTIPVNASPYESSWGTVGFGFGGPAKLSGDFTDRLDESACGASCPLSVRFAVGSGVGRWGVELEYVGMPVVDTAPVDRGDNERSAVRMGPVVSYTLVRRFAHHVGFDLAVRGGLQLGSLHADSVPYVVADPNCPPSKEGGCPGIEMTYEPPSYGLAAVPVGATLRIGARPEGSGLIAAFADLDYTFTRISFTEGARTGAMRTLTFGLVFGMMFDFSPRQGE
jgi:hypothetical protein